MKTNKLLIGGLALGFLFAGCKKDSSSLNTSSPVSSVDVASSVGAALATNGYGIVSQMQDASNLTSSGIVGQLQVSAPGSSGLGQSGIMSAVVPNYDVDTLPCGFFKNITFSKSDSNNTFAYSRFVHYYFMMNCTNNVRTELTMSDSSRGHFNGPRLISNTSTVGNLGITGLTKADSLLTLNGAFTHSGSFQSKVNDSVSFSSTLKITLTNAQVSKKTHEVVGGTADLTVSGINKKKMPFNFTGTISFLSRRRAKVVIGNDSYTFNLITGDLDDNN